MMERIVSESASTKNEFEDFPLSLLLIRYVWPFWLFRDASRGNDLARAAAYRHNRGMRVYLPGYLMKWTITTFLALGASRAFGSLSSHGGGAPDLFLIGAAGAGIVFAAGLCMLFIMGYIYLFLSRNTY